MKHHVSAGIVLAWALSATAARAEHVERGFTVWDNLNSVQWPEGDNRRALILGNGRYNDGKTIRPDAPHPLGNLGTTCDDAYLIASSLVKVGWKPPQIAVACNQTNDQLNTALTHVVTAIRKASTAPQMTLVYLAGHGMQVGQRNYFFGVNAKPDMQSAADVALDSDGGELFTDGATNVTGYFSNTLGHTTPSAILLVLDSCRDDPLFKQAQILLRAEASEDYHGNERAIARATNGAITAPKGANTPWGMSVFYASHIGSRVADDNGANGHSRLAAAFSDMIGQFAGANRVVSETGMKVSHDTSLLEADDQQFPDTSGPLAGDPCIATCKVAGPNEVHGAVAASTAFNPKLFHLAALLSQNDEDDGLDRSANTSKPAIRRSVTLAQSETGTPVGRTTEVFWCAGAADSARKSALAADLAKSVLEKRNVAGSGFETVRNIYVTELSPDENAKPGNQINDDTIVYDPSTTDLVTKMKSLSASIALDPIRSSASNYVAAYFCKGAYLGPVSATVFLQVPRDGGIDPGNDIVKTLRTRFPELNTIPELDTRPPAFPSHTEVRFYDGNKRVLSEKIAKALRNSLQIPVSSKYFKRLATQHSSGQIEIWLSEADVDTANAVIRNRRPAYP